MSAAPASPSRGDSTVGGGLDLLIMIIIIVNIYGAFIMCQALFHPDTDSLSWQQPHE